MFWDGCCFPHQGRATMAAAQTTPTRKAFGNTAPDELNYDPEFLLLVSLPNTAIPPFNRTQSSTAFSQTHISPSATGSKQSEVHKLGRRTVSWEAEVKEEVKNAKLPQPPRAVQRCRSAGGVGVQSNGRVLSDKEKFEAMLAQTKDNQAEESRQRRILDYSRMIAASRHTEMEERQGLFMGVKSAADQCKKVTMVHQKGVHQPSCRCDECEKIFRSRMAFLKLQEDIDLELEQARRTF